MKKMKKAFSMVELLFVMAIMAALAAIAIPQLSSSKDAEILVAMQNDAKNAITTMNSVYSQTLDYTLISEKNKSIRYSDAGNGLSNPLLTGDKFSVSKDNTIVMYVYSDQCYSFWIDNPNMKYDVQFESCDNGKIITKPVNPEG